MVYTPTAIICGPRFQSDEEFNGYVKTVYCYRILKDKGYSKEESLALVDNNSIKGTGNIDELIKWCEAMAPREVVFGRQGDTLEKDS